MAYTKKWFDKFRYNTTMPFWQFIGFSTLRFWKDMYYDKGLKEPMVFTDLDRILCPELFFAGFMRLLAVRYSFNNEDDRREAGKKSPMIVKTTMILTAPEQRP